MNIDKLSKSQYARILCGVACIVLGAFFLIEHIMVWEEIAFFDFIGHEWLGFVLILVGILINMNWSRERLSEEIKGILNKWRKNE